MKPTLSGAAVPVTGRNGRRATVVAALAAVGVLAAAAFLIARARVAPGVHPSIVAEPSADPSTAVASLDPPTADSDLPALEPAPSSSAHHDPFHPPHTVPSVTPPHAIGSAASASAVPPAPSAPVATATAAAPVPAASVAVAVASDPSFDPAKAYVEVGLVNAQGVRESAVRAAIRGTGLAGCYRSALKTRGSRATGVATLDLSIDENGGARSAIVVGADFLPGLARCVQGATSGVHLPRSQVDSGGGTAEVTLAFKAP